MSWISGLRAIRGVFSVGWIHFADVTPEQFRARFPILRQRVYVNSCSQGALSVDVEEALAAFVQSWHEHGSPWDRWVADVERLRTAFAALVGADADEIAVMPSASSAIAAIATALSFDGAKRGVVLGRFEFPTLAHVWLAEERRGASITWADAVDDTLPITSYVACIDPKTLIVPATHVCFRNGYRVDVPALVETAHARGALVMLDDYQHSGTATLDVHALDVDFMVTGALKYLLGPSGVAFLYVKRTLIESLTPLTTGWFGREHPFAFRLDPLDWSPSARRFEAGTPPVPNAVAAAAGIALLETLGLEQVNAQIRRLVARFDESARSRGFVVATPSDPARRGPLVVLRSTDAGALVTRLAARGVIASARDNGLRVSFHAYNNEADVDAVLEALESEAALLVRP
jgi:selenocysteine lyase/cysteine desulfurase